MEFYTYLWLREDGTPYYVGKGSGDRAYRSHRRGNRPTVRPPLFRDRVILQEWPCEKDSLIAEIFLISFYGRKDTNTGCLRNLTDGGEGVTGRPPLSLDARQRISKSRIGKPTRFGTLTEETKRKISLSLTGKKRSVESIRKQSESRRGIRLSKEHKDAISRANKGRIFSEEHRKRIGITSVGRFARDARGRLVAWGVVV